MKKSIVSKMILGLFIAVSAISMQGCATIVSGSNQKISVTSNPSGAEAKADNNITSKTPASFTLDRKTDHTIEISKDGYKTAIILIKRTANGMVFGNAVFGGLIGTGVDIASGANQKLVPEKVDIVLESGQGTSLIPQFLNPKDQEYYEKSILGRGGKSAATVASTQPVVDTKTQPANNFAANPAPAPIPAK